MYGEFESVKKMRKKRATLKKVNKQDQFKRKFELLSLKL